MKRSASRTPLHVLPVVGHEAPHLDPVDAVEVLPQHRPAQRAEPAEAVATPRRTGGRRSRSRRRRAPRRRSRAASRPFQSISSSTPKASMWLRTGGETSWPASSSVRPYQPSSPQPRGVEGVVVGEQHHVDAGALAVAGDLLRPCRSRRSRSSGGGRRRRGRGTPRPSVSSRSIRPFHEFDEANATWPRGDRLEAIRTAADEFRAPLQGAGAGARRAHRRPGERRLPDPLRLRRRRPRLGEPLHQHPQPPGGRAVRGLRGRPQDPVLGAHRARGLERGAVLRPADRALRRAALEEPALHRVQHRRPRRSRSAGSRRRTSTSCPSTTSTCRTCGS